MILRSDTAAYSSTLDILFGLTMKPGWLDRALSRAALLRSTGGRGSEERELTKDDNSDVDGAEDAELVGLLEEAVLALEDGYVVYEDGCRVLIDRVLSECQEN